MVLTGSRVLTGSAPSRAAMSVSIEPPADICRLPRRVATAHKGDFGRILIVGGSLGMHGAPLLAAAAAFRSGAGLVTIALPRTLYAIAGAAELRATWLPLPDHDGHLDSTALPLLLAAVARADVVAVGPGLSGAPETAQLLRELVPRIDRPLVLDADGLNAFAGEPAHLAGHRKATIVTPHAGELRRLTGQTPGHDDESRRVATIDLAMRAAATVILKGHRSVVSNGLETHFNPTGNPGMATGGCGDVLTGCLAALLAVVPDELLAARIGAYAHGLAGDHAAARLGEIGLTATDVIDELPAALATLLAATA
ncbi:MAG: NAD(P)H-hydrate dehydratase [Planctomycetes bacterium]|nr:NAD(P)H-hydrate dehydratase [Planctomycetota bacterium]